FCLVPWRTANVKSFDGLMNFFPKLDIKEEIEEEEKTLQDYTDKKMADVELDTLEKMYTIASQCLHQMKNRRPDIKTVLHALENITATLSSSEFA
ncbi:hypothetical protein FKM82_024898, partial [Ascaphus truei]